MYRTVSRVGLTDGETTLAFIIESNGRLWRLYYQLGEAKSAMAWFPSPQGVEAERDVKVAEARAMGWTEITVVGIDYAKSEWDPRETGEFGAIDGPPEEI